VLVGTTKASAPKGLRRAREPVLLMAETAEVSGLFVDCTDVC
jgi:hypothetical protein